MSPVRMDEEEEEACFIYNRVCMVKKGVRYYNNCTLAKCKKGLRCFNGRERVVW